MALWLSLGFGALVAVVTFTVESLTNVRPARHWWEIAPLMLDELTTSCTEFLRDPGRGEAASARHGSQTDLALVGFRRYFVI